MSFIGAAQGAAQPLLEPLQEQIHDLRGQMVHLQDQMTDLQIKFDEQNLFLKQSMNEFQQKHIDHQRYVDAQIKEQQQQIKEQQQQMNAQIKEQQQQMNAQIKEQQQHINKFRGDIYQLKVGECEQKYDTNRSEFVRCIRRIGE